MSITVSWLLAGVGLVAPVAFAIFVTIQGGGWASERLPKHSVSIMMGLFAVAMISFAALAFTTVIPGFYIAGSIFAILSVDC
jgi:hypothetical protein